MCYKQSNRISPGEFNRWGLSSHDAYICVSRWFAEVRKRLFDRAAGCPLRAVTAALLGADDMIH